MPAYSAKSPRSRLANGTGEPTSSDQRRSLGASAKQRSTVPRSPKARVSPTDSPSGALAPSRVSVCGEAADRAESGDDGAPAAGVPSADGVHAAWMARVTAAQTSATSTPLGAAETAGAPHTVTLGSVRVLGRPGVAPVFFPRVASRTALTEDGEDPVGAWAREQAEQLIRVHQRQGATVLVAHPADEVVGWPISRTLGRDEPFDPELDYLILIPKHGIGR